MKMWDHEYAFFSTGRLTVYIMIYMYSLYRMSSIIHFGDSLRVPCVKAMNQDNIIVKRKINRFCQTSNRFSPINNGRAFEGVAPPPPPDLDSVTNNI